MDDDALTAERRVALSYSPPHARAGLEALLALDAKLGQVVRTTREVLVGQMRLTWWADALAALDTEAPPAEPVLTALATEVLPAGVTGAALAGVIDGWEMLLEPLDAAAVAQAARARGEPLFAAMGRVLGGAVPEGAGEGWAAADLAAHLSDLAAATAAREVARTALGRALKVRWPVEVRAVGALAVLARDDVSDRPGAPAGLRRTGKMLRHRLTGR